MAEMTLAELAAQLGGTLEGDGTRVVRGMGSLESAREDQVSFLANARYERFMAETVSAAVIVSADYSGPPGKGGQTGLIRCKDAYFAYRQAMVHFYGFRKPRFSGVHPTAIIDPTAEIGTGVSIGANVVIEGECKIGEGTVIYPGVFIGHNTVVGRECLLYPNVTLYDGTVLHDRVTIHAGSSLGHDGFGYATHAGEDGVVRHEKIPQAGWVEIEDDVEIGACCAIDRATMGATVIGAGTKFSNLVAIGHGTQMGKHCLMVAQAGIAGSVMVGNYCVFAGQCGVVGHVRIGDGVKVGAKSGVVNDIESGQEVLGSPALPLYEAKRQVIASIKLPQLRDTMRQLSLQIKALQKKLGLENNGEDK
jgi:UDP-3-O-[3-hydroxymyristoyl] glucosamine N-acyltransferase